MQGWRGGRWLLILLAIVVAGSCRSVPKSMLEIDLAALDAPAPDIYVVRFATTKGDIDVMVHREWGPLGADRLYGLVRHRYYDGARFFRAVQGFMVQFGLAADSAVTAVMTERALADDPVRQENLRGTLSFATAGPNTRTTQLFLNLVDNRFLDQNGFTVIGRVISDLKVLDALYTGYGEPPPQGRGPEQRRIVREGEEYLARQFPLLDKITSATIIEQYRKRR